MKQVWGLNVLIYTDLEEYLYVYTTFIQYIEINFK
jgi:hypothetical protein